LSQNKHESDELSNTTSLSSTTCWAQKNMDLVSYQTHRLWVWHRIKPKWIRIWWIARPGALGLGCALSPIRHGSSKLRDPSPLDLVACQAQLGIGLVCYLTRCPWVNYVPSSSGHVSDSLSYPLTVSLVACHTQRTKRFGDHYRPHVGLLGFVCLFL